MATQTNRNKPTHHEDQTDDPIHTAAEYGIDISQLRDNLRLTVAERLRRHQMALNTVEMLQKARRL